MAQHSPSDSATTPGDDQFDVTEFSKELQMIVSFAILDLDVVRDADLAAA